MYNVDNIIKKLNQKLNNDFEILKKLQKKQTARSLQKYLLVDNQNKKYLLEIATNSIEIFYFNRTIKFQKEFSQLKHNFKLNMPIYIQTGNKLSYALYNYYEDIIYLKDDRPIELLKDFYKENSIEVELNDKNIEKIISNFLSTWPNMYHSMIKRQKEFRLYMRELNRLKTILVAFEHGDFNGDNIALISNEIYLLDFEFSKGFQPIEFDIYDYFKLKNKSIKNDIKYYDLNKIKYQLIDKINTKIDDDTTLEIYDELDDDTTLRESWNKLYEKGANYNLSLQWCETWLKHFKKENQELFIFTIWQDDTLKLLAPLYKRKNILYLIGSNPDLFDSFNILYDDEKHIKYFLSYIFKKNYQIDFRYLDANTEFSKILIKYLYQNKISYTSNIVDTKPYVNLDNFKIKTKEKSDIKRCKNRAIKNCNSEMKFNFMIDKTEHILSDFIKIHKNRWDGGPFEKIQNFDLFIKNIAKTDLVVLSKLELEDKNIAYHFAYVDSYNILNSAIPSYSNKYNDISPGKVLLFEMIEYCKSNNFKIFDFGRGAEEYKYRFSNESTILFNLKSLNNKGIFFKIKFFLKRVKNKICRILDV